MNLYTLTDKNGNDILLGGKVRWWSKRYRTHFEGVLEKVTMFWRNNYIFKDESYQKNGGEVITTYHIRKDEKKRWFRRTRRTTIRNVKNLESLSGPLYNT